MDEFNNSNVKQGKRKTVLIIILLLVVLGLAGFIVYDKCIKTDNSKDTDKVIEDKTDKTETKDDTTKIIDKEDNISIDDEVVFVSDGKYKFYGYIKDGKLQYYYDKGNDEYSHYMPFDDKLISYDELNNIKRIKVLNIDIYTVSPIIYLITEDGKVYEMSFYSNTVSFKQSSIFNNYNVDNIINVNKSEHIIQVLLKDGTISNIQY